MVFWQDESTIQILTDLLKQDKVIVASGDTVLGLWAQLSEKGFLALNDIKVRNEKPYLITIPSADNLNFFIDQPLTSQHQTLIETCWPGPVTLIFKARADLPSWMVSSQKTIALRVPDHAGLMKLMKNFNGLFSTSANMHGGSVPSCLQQIDPLVLAKTGTVCLQQGQTCYSVQASTILDCSGDKIEIVRSGAYFLQNLKDLIV